MGATASRHTAQKPDWRVLMIGGSSGTGKTVLAHQLARRFEVDLTQVDDLRLALQRVTTPEDQPVLHFFLATPRVWQRPAEELKAALIGVSRVVSRAVEAVIEHHLDTPYPIILEGDGIAPALAAQHTRGQGAADVRAIFLFEPTEEGILANMAERGRGFDHHQLSGRQTQARMHWLYAQWLRQEAEQLGLSTLSTRPRDTLLERAVNAISWGASSSHVTE